MISRGEFFLYNFLLFIAGAATGGNPVIIFIILCLQVWAICSRLVDIGMSKWWVLTNFIPLINFYLAFATTFFPSGYKIVDHENFKQKDGIYYLGIGLFLTVFLSTFVLTLYFGQQ